MKRGIPKGGNLLKACQKLKKDMKQIFKLDVEIIPTFVPQDNEIGFVMFEIAKPTDKEEKSVRFVFNPSKAIETGMPVYVLKKAKE